MVNDYAFSEVVRKLANIIRIGKISDIEGHKIKVQLDRVKTDWLPIVSTAGEDAAWLPISKGEVVAVFAPYGEYSQAFALRSFHYNGYPSPTDKETVALDLEHKANIKGKKDCEISFEDGIEIKSGESIVSIKNGGITFEVGDTSFKITSEGISLSCGNSVLDIGDGSISLESSDTISLSSGDIVTEPPVCKCGGV